MLINFVIVLWLLGVDWWETQHEPAMHTCSPESQSSSCIRSSRTSRAPLICSCETPHRELLIQLCSPRHKDTELLEQAQRSPPGWSEGYSPLWGSLSLLWGQDELRLFNLEQRRPWGDLSTDFQYLKGATKKSGEGHITSTCSDRTRGNGFKLKDSTFSIGIRKKFFTAKVVRSRDRLPGQAVDASSLKMFKARFYGTLTTWSSGKRVLPTQNI